MKTLQPFLLTAMVLLSCNSVTRGDDLQSLRDALTLHASFDDGLNADFSRGEKSCLVLQDGALKPAETNPDVTIVPEGGRFGNSLQFTRKSTYRPLFPGKEIVNYSPEDWSVSVSVWLKLTPDQDLEPGYCDPIQIVGDDLKKGFVFLEWSKDVPRFFRFATRPLVSIWNPKNVSWEEIPAAERPMVQVEKAPFSAEKWTHVVFTIDNANDSSKAQRGQLFLNGELIGTIQDWDLKFGWNPEKVQLVLGAAYVGGMDDLSVFNRALTADEVHQLNKLPNGVRDLHQK